ncbi:unnamed protein product [Lampetra planeri]
MNAASALPSFVVSADAARLNGRSQSAFDRGRALATAVLQERWLAVRRQSASAPPVDQSILRLAAETRPCQGVSGEALPVTR